MTDRSSSGEDLREAIARVAEIAGDGSACPDPERLVSSAQGELPEREEGEIALHIAECTACAAAWRVVREAAGEASTHEAAPLTRPRRPWTAWLAAAAVLLVAIGLGSVWLSRGPDTSTVYRTQGERWLECEISEDTPLSREAFLLRWKPGPEGTVYDVLVTGETAEPIARGVDLDDPEYQVPPEALESLSPGSTLYWQVIARFPDGRRAESETYIAKVE